MELWSDKGDTQERTVPEAEVTAGMRGSSAAVIPIISITWTQNEFPGMATGQFRDDFLNPKLYGLVLSLG